MKKYIKLVVVIAGITLATFGNISKANAKKAEDIGGRVCSGGGFCIANEGGSSVAGHTNN